MVNKNIMEKLLNLVREGTIPAIGCTVTVEVAYSASVDKRCLKEEIEGLDILGS